MDLFKNPQKFGHGLFLAPMAGVTDQTYRAICKSFGAEFLVTEMVSSKGVYFNDKKTGRLARIEDGESPAGVQIFGHEPEIMAIAAQKLVALDYNGCVSERAPDFVDINMGCPVHKIVSSGDGSALMKNPDLIYDIVKAVASAVNVPVTVKIRAGWDKNSINATECAKAAEEAGASLITVHARTREQMYTDFYDWSVIADVKKSVSVPVVGNGSIFSAADVLAIKEQTGCDGVMIGRACQGNPFIFREIRQALEGKEITPKTNEEVANIAARHLEMICREKGEMIGILEMRKHLGWYSHGMRGSPTFRNKCNLATTFQEMMELTKWLADPKEE
jgi:nifR3 family TIM-barrel protein